MKHRTTDNRQRKIYVYIEELEAFARDQKAIDHMRKKCLTNDSREIGSMRNRAEVDLDNKENKNEGDSIDATWLAACLDATFSDGDPFAVVYFREQPFLLFLCSANGKAIYKDRSGNVELAGCARPGVGSGKW